MSRSLEKYIEVFPPVLFLCSDNVHPMHFILSLKHLSDDQQEELVELLHHCGAELSFNVEDATGYSAVIVDHEEVVNVKAPAFTIKFIKECLSKVKVQNISDYRQDATRHIASNLQCMDVVYRRIQSWDSVLTKAEKQWFEENVDSSRSVEHFEPQAASRDVDISSPVSTRFGSCENKGDSQPDEENRKNTSGCRLSSDEDSDVQETDDQVRENEICEEAKNIPKNNITKKENSRNLKAIKESTNSLSKALDFKSKSGTAVDSGKNKNTSSRSRETDTVSSTSAPSSKWSFLDEFHPVSSDEEDVHPKATEKEKKKNFFDFDAGNEDLYKPTKDKKHSRMPYSYDEQSKILKYIVDHHEFPRLKGRELWMIMERRKICPNRTWQSMKEHFMKKISLNLEAFDFLTESNKMKIKQIVF